MDKQAGFVSERAEKSLFPVKRKVSSVGCFVLFFGLNRRYFHSDNLILASFRSCLLEALHSKMHLR